MYDATQIEGKWRQYWKEREELFAFDEKDDKKKVFTIDTPPPFTNGELHMGQIFWVSYIDALARYKRMKGFNVLYPVGWDAHGFPTELAVEKKFGRGLGREEFYGKCVELSTGLIKTMRDQMLLLGATFDSRYEYTTTSDDYMARVQLSVVEMFEKGLIYRAAHPVEWCTRCMSGISREEAVEKEEDSFLNYVDFKIESKAKEEKPHYITIATSRPELLHACVALAVNPKDARYKNFVGKSVEIPLFKRSVKVIADEEVDKKYGTGAEMVCTFGDKRDINLYYKHKLKLIEAMDESGHLKNAGEFDGLTLEKAREEIVARLTQLSYLKKREPIKHTVKVHDRDSSPLEFISSMQWFMKTKDHAEDIKKVSKEVNWVPESTRQRLDDWANFIEWDYNFSRSRTFGTPIPFWNCEKCDFILAPNKKGLPMNPLKDDSGLKKCPKCGGKVVGSKEVLDGWIDTSITPLVIAGWPNKKKLVARAYPNSLRIQGTDIVRTWAFYTIYRSHIIGGSKPWEHIICHGMILGEDGREMHKRFGNGIFLANLVPKYPIDAVRLWVALSGGIGKDKAFSYMELDYARSFLIKFYNTANFVKGALEKAKLPSEEPHKHFNIFDIWIMNRLNGLIKDVTASYDGYILNEAMNRAIDFYWHEFADYYIENVKHRVYSTEKGMENSKKAALYTLKYVLDTSLKIFAPVMPHLCEEVNSMFNKGSIFQQSFPEYVERPQPADYVINGMLQKSTIEIDYDGVGTLLNDIIGNVRQEKAKSKIALNKEITSININVPETYYSAVTAASNEIKAICKAGKVNVKKSKEFSVSISV